MFDLVRPRLEERITLSDLKNCRMANIFFDTFFNLDKFIDHEQRDPFANARVSSIAFYERTWNLTNILKRERRV
jgi:serine/threonine-protein phosphatase 2A regulatory subunit B''